MEEEDWDAPENDPAKSTSQQNSNSTSQQLTLKITDGYKYSYEALASPANVDDWIDPPSFTVSRRSSNGLSQNYFREGRDNRDKSFKNDRGDNFKSRFEKRSNAYSSSGDFQAPKSRFSNNTRPHPRPVEDWDAPTDTAANTMNGSWSANVNVPIITNAEESWNALTRTPQNHRSTPRAVPEEEEDWDAPAGTSSRNEKSPTDSAYRSSSSHNIIHPVPTEPLSMLETHPPVVNDEEENWDDPSEVSTQEKSGTFGIMPTYNPSSANLSQSNLSTHDEENWDTEPNQSSTSLENGYGKAIPTYQSSSNDDQSYSGNQRYDNWQGNKYPRSRNYDANDPFTREPYNRHSRGNYRNNTYDRGPRGSRGRGNRDHRDGFNSSYHSRDNSRSRNDRGDRSYQKSYNKNDRQTPVSYNTVVEPEEDWDSPTGFVQKSSENDMPPPPAQMTPIQSMQSSTPAADEESWD